MNDRLADIGFGISLAGLTWGTLAHATEIAQFVAIVLSCLTAAASGGYYVLKIMEKLRERKEKGDSR